MAPAPVGAPATPPGTCNLCSIAVTIAPIDTARRRARWPTGRSWEVRLVGVAPEIRVQLVQTD